MGQGDPRSEYQAGVSSAVAAPISGTPMFKIAAILIFAISLAACDAVNTVTEGFSHARAVEKDLQESTGIKPTVSFNWHNGQLVSVTVQFPRIYESKPLGELAEIIRASVSKQFKQKPENIVVAFSLVK
jgi:hypothetical protein